MEFNTDFVKAEQALQYIGMKASCNDEQKSARLKELGAECAFVPGTGRTGKQLIVRTSTLDLAKNNFASKKAQQDAEAAERIKRTQFISYQDLCQEFRAMREEFLALAEKLDALINRGTH
jgi:hypothetical protein